MHWTYRTFPFFLLICFGCLGAAGLEPTPTGVRSWHSLDGRSVEAVATGLADGMVTFRMADGRGMRVPLTALAEDDRAFLRKHFAPPPLPHPTGRSIGPINAGKGASYFLYLPPGLDSRVSAPTMVFTGSTGGNKMSYKPYQFGLDTFGWIFIAVVESRNGIDYNVNLAKTQTCLAHARQTLPIHAERLYFSGGSGGGSMALRCLGHMKGAGALPMVCYLPRDHEIDKDAVHVFLASGASDYNRYLSASAVSYFGPRAVHRFHDGGHGIAPPWLLTDGIAWLDAQYALEHRRDHPDEALRFEASMAKLIEALRDKQPHRAYAWALFMAQTYKATGPESAAMRETGRALREEATMRYAASLADFHAFSMEHFAEIRGGSLWAHTTPQLREAGAKLAAKYAGVPIAEDVSALLGAPTAARKQAKKKR